MSSILYSILLPVYNEKENLPLIIGLIDQVFIREYVCLLL